MGYIKFNHKGNFKKTERFFNHVLRMDYLNILERYGQAGVSVLSQATPTDSGKTAESWDFGIEKGDGKVTIYWTNSNTNDGANVAILLIYGHALWNGAYVQGSDFASPAIEPIFQQMAQECWREVVR